MTVSEQTMVLNTIELLQKGIVGALNVLKFPSASHCQGFQAAKHMNAGLPFHRQQPKEIVCPIRKSYLRKRLGTPSATVVLLLTSSFASSSSND